MTRQHTTTTTRPSRFAALAMTGVLAVLIALASTVSTATSAQSAPAAQVGDLPKYIAPTSVTVAGHSCKDVGDGNTDVTVKFKVTGGRYLNFGHPSNTADILNNNRRYDNVRAGGTRYVPSTIHFYYRAGVDDATGLPSPQTETFTYQQAVAPITKQGVYVSTRKIKVLHRDFDVTFTCP